MNDVLKPKLHKTQHTNLFNCTFSIVKLDAIEMWTITGKN